MYQLKEPSGLGGLCNVVSRIAHGWEGQGKQPAFFTRGFPASDYGDKPGFTGIPARVLCVSVRPHFLAAVLKYHLLVHMYSTILGLRFQTF